MSEKNIDKDAYVWGHVATIIFHVILGLVIITYALKINSAELKNIRLVLLIAGGLLVVVSLLGLVPILKDYNKIIIE